MYHMDGETSFKWRVCSDSVQYLPIITKCNINGRIVEVCFSISADAIVMNCQLILCKKIFQSKSSHAWCNWNVYSFKMKYDQI